MYSGLALVIELDTAIYRTNFGIRYLFTVPTAGSPAGDIFIYYIIIKE